MLRSLGAIAAVLFALGLIAAPLSAYWAKAHIEVMVVATLSAALAMLTAGALTLVVHARLTTRA